MPFSIARSTLALLFAALAAAGPTQAADGAPARPPLDHFFDNSAFSAARLSPDARALAVRVAVPGKRAGLAVVDLATLKIVPVAGFSDADINRFEWVNNRRLVFDTADRQVAWGDQNRAPGLYAVNRDGADLIQLVNRESDEGAFAVDSTSRRKMLRWNNYLMPQKGMQDSDFIYVYSPDFDSHDDQMPVDLRRVSAQTGEVRTVARPAHTHGWLLDHKGEPRIAVAGARDLTTIHYLDPGTGKWRQIASFGTYSGTGEAFSPLAFGPDGTLFVETNAGKDKSAVHTFDLATGKISAEPIVTTAGYDFSGALITGKDKVLGLRLTTDAESTIWFDARLKQIQAAVDAKLPSTVNLVSVAARPETPWVLVESYSDQTPKTFFVFNIETATFTQIGSTHPKILPQHMSMQEAVRYTARDGLEIPALLTIPAGTSGKNLPLVVLVHGGPFIRGASWGWEAQTQFLASRGYAVLQPEYRGSTGFGDKHFKAGWKQWGLAMQNDIADGAKWAAAKGYADPKRICIAGASYGGYAALMGLVNDPDIFKCGINWVGVTDLDLLYGRFWIHDDWSERYRKYGMPVLVGDRVKDAAQLRATSPLHQAARITQPLLLAYGGSDERVPIAHGQKLHAAVKGHNPNVEWVAYPAEGHGWALPKTRYDFWSRVEKFLDRNIGKP